jgi:hypothetical protein
MDDLERTQRLRALPPAIPDYALSELADELHCPVDREACEREIVEDNLRPRSMSLEGETDGDD